MKFKWLLGLMLASLLLGPLGSALAAPPEAQVIDLETLKGMLGDPQVMVIDVRIPSSYAESDKKIKGAVREDPGKVSTWGKTLPRDKKIVLYCS